MDYLTELRQFIRAGGGGRGDIYKIKLDSHRGEIIYKSTCCCFRRCTGPRGGGRSGRARSLRRRFRLRDVFLPPVWERHFRSLRVGDLRHRGVRWNVLRDVELREDPLKVFKGLVRVRRQGLGRLVRVLGEQYRTVNDIPVKQRGLYGPFLETDGSRRVPRQRKRQVSTRPSELKYLESLAWVSFLLSKLYR